jgi:hypothetical protein
MGSTTRCSQVGSAAVPVLITVFHLLYVQKLQIEYIIFFSLFFRCESDVILGTDTRQRVSGGDIS